jgi:NADPH-dependent curcumin reductase
MSKINHQVRLAARPKGEIKPSDWQFTQENVGEPGDGEACVEVHFVSLDPAMRGWLNEGRSYIPPVGIGDVMRAGGVGRIVASRAPGFSAGDYVSGVFGVQEYCTLPADRLTKVDANKHPLPVYLGALGMPGMTAYFGLLDIGRPNAGETVVVSGAAGAVGSLVGQIAKIEGCRAVGIAGGADKCRYLIEELGFDEAIDYKAGDLKPALRKACPQGVDVYFDNVGGDTLDIALTQLRRNARVVICGAISQYNNLTAVKGPANYMSLLVNRASMTGFVVFDYEKRYGEAAAHMSDWIVAGKLKTKTHIEKGLQHFPEALSHLFAGANTGKFVLDLGKS